MITAIKLNNKKVDMTTFLNLCIKKKRLRLEVANSKLSWYEIDTIEDYNYAKQIKNVVWIIGLSCSERC